MEFRRPSAPEFTIHVQESYISKVEKIVKIKQKQDEDKAAAKLHNLNKLKIDEDVVSLIEEIEKAKMLGRASSAVKLNTTSIHEKYPEVVLYIEVYRNLKLIKDTFYNDMRDLNAIDYSRPILDWIRTSKEEAFKKWEHIVRKMGP